MQRPRAPICCQRWMVLGRGGTSYRLRGFLDSAEPQLTQLQQLGRNPMMRDPKGHTKDLERAVPRVLRSGMLRFSFMWSSAPTLQNAAKTDRGSLRQVLLFDPS